MLNDRTEEDLFQILEHWFRPEHYIAFQFSHIADPQYGSLSRFWAVKPHSLLSYLCKKVGRRGYVIIGAVSAFLPAIAPMPRKLHKSNFEVAETPLCMQYDTVMINVSF